MLDWIKNIIFKGLIILIPLVLLWLTIRELFELLVAFAELIADFFPEDTFGWVTNPELVSPILIMVIAILLGTLASIPPVRRVSVVLERKTLGRLPLYRMIKTFISAFLEMEDNASFRPALILEEEGGAQPCYVIEDRESAPNVVVLVPWSPASFAGSVRLVPRARIRRLDISFDQFSLSLANFGLGMHSLTEMPEAEEKGARN
jgi:uncharacterized membrane protein